MGDHDDILGGFHAALGLDDLSSDSEEEEETVVSPINIEPTKQKIVKRKQQEIEDELDNLLTGPSKINNANEKLSAIDATLQKDTETRKMEVVDLNNVGDELSKALGNMDESNATQNKKPRRKKSLKRKNTV